jgi:hypothetical protein
MLAEFLWMAKDLIVVFLGIYLVMKELPKDLRAQGTVLGFGVRIRRSLYCAFSSYAAAWVIVFVPLLAGYFLAKFLGMNVAGPNVSEGWSNVWKWSGFVWPFALCGIALARSYSVSPRISGLKE